MTPVQESNSRPVTVVLRELLDAQALTLRAVASRTREVDESGKGINHTYISSVLSGRERPSPRSLELIAGVLELEPEFFAEYRMWKLRRELDPAVVGFDSAVQRFQELTDGHE